MENGTWKMYFLNWTWWFSIAVMLIFQGVHKKHFSEGVLPGKLTCPLKIMVGRCISYWNGPFLGDMLVFRGVVFRETTNFGELRCSNRGLAAHKHWFGQGFLAPKTACEKHGENRNGTWDVADLTNEAGSNGTTKTNRFATWKFRCFFGLGLI